MRVIDLGWPIEDSMQVFPGDISPEIKELTKIEEEGCRSKKIIISSHTGTHMDAPLSLIHI